MFDIFSSHSKPLFLATPLNTTTMSAHKSTTAQGEKSQKNKRKTTDGATEASKRLKVMPSILTGSASAGPSRRATTKEEGTASRGEDVIMEEVISSGIESEGESSEAELGKKKYY